MRKWLLGFVTGAALLGLATTLSLGADTVLLSMNPSSDASLTLVVTGSAPVANADNGTTESSVTGTASGTNGSLLGMALSELELLPSSGGPLIHHPYSLLAVTGEASLGSSLTASGTTGVSETVIVDPNSPFDPIYVTGIIQIGVSGQMHGASGSFSGNANASVENIGTITTTMSGGAGGPTSYVTMGTFNNLLLGPVPVMTASPGGSFVGQFPYNRSNGFATSTRCSLNSANVSSAPNGTCSLQMNMYVECTIFGDGFVPGSIEPDPEPD